MCESPARLAGLGGQKGRIAPGYDADLVVLDPEAEFVVDPSRLYHRHTLTPYTGATLRGVVRTTYGRGRKAYDAGGFAPEAGGRWLKRS
jgi:allantoinase